MENDVRFTIDIPKSLHTKIKRSSIASGQSMKLLVCNALELIVDNSNGEVFYNIFSFIKSKVSLKKFVLEIAISPEEVFEEKESLLKINCPFCKEEESSLTVNKNKEIFFCFKCNVGGDVISFVSRYYNCSPSDAIRKLIKLYDIEVPDTYMNILNQKDKYSEST